MTELKLDFSNVKHFGDIHKIMREAFAFPDYYGENLDALWDCMRDYCEYELHVIVSGLEQLSVDYKDYMGKVFKVFNDVHDECNVFTFEILD